MANLKVGVLYELAGGVRIEYLGKADIDGDGTYLFKGDAAGNNGRFNPVDGSKLGLDYAGPVIEIWDGACDGQLFLGIDVSDTFKEVGEGGGDEN